MPQKLGDVEKEVLKKIKPSREEYNLVFTVYNRIKSVLENVLKEHGVDAEITLQGSIAKDTWLSGDRDLDIFVLFPKSWSVEKLKNEGFKLLYEAARIIGRYQIRYAEHPYVRVFVEGIEADLVPAYKLDDPSEIKTAVDRTPFHTRYIIEHLPPELRDHVRLLKKFMKGIGVYGAEVKIKGFSGYLAELLIIHYRGFKEVLEAASRWRPPVFINILRLRNEEASKLFKRLMRKYPDNILYIPDPIDPERNAAAAVSKKAVSIFSLAARCYLNKPSMTFFGFSTPPETSIEELINEVEHYNRCILFLVFPLTKYIPPDNLWGELNRIRDRAIKILELFDFKVSYSDAWSDERSIAIIGFEIEQCMLPEYKYHKGPPYNALGRAESFIAKHYGKAIAGPWIDDRGFLNAIIARKYVAAYQVLVERVDEYLVAPDFKNIKPIVTSIHGLEIIVRKFKGLESWLRVFVKRRFPWMESCIP